MELNRLSLVTIVTVVYNDVNHIEKTILSVINQTYSNIEYIVIDGGSTDGTVDIIRKYKENISYWVSESDKGIYDAMNKGIRRAKGNWCCFLNSGDLFVGLDTIKTIFEKHCYKCDVLYSDTIHVFKAGKFICKAEPIDILNTRMPFCHQSCFVRTEILKDNEFDCSYKIAADYNLFYHLYNQKVSFLYLDIPISIFDNIEGVSSNNPILLFKEYSRINGKSAWRKIFKWKLKNILKNIFLCFPKNIRLFLDEKYKSRFTVYKKIN